MRFEENKNYLIISPREYKSALLKAKKKYPLSNIKIIDKNEIIDKLAFSFKETKNPIDYLLSKEEYDYSQIKKILNIIRIGKIDGNPFFSKIYEELKENGYLNFDIYGRKEMDRYQNENGQVFLFESDEDEELQKFLIRHNVSFEVIHFSDFGYEGKYRENQPLILNFENKFKQYLYIFSDVRAKLQENSDLQNRIIIYAENASDLFYIEFCKHIFKIPVMTQIKVPLVSDEIVHQNLIAFQQNQNLDFVTEIPENSAAMQLKKNIEHYHLDKLSFRFAYASLMEILSSQTINNQYDDRGIGLTNMVSFSDEIIYVTCFQHDVFYKECDDSNIVSDDALVKMEVNPSYVKTKMDRRMKENYIRQNEIALLSRVELHLQDKIYDSQFLEEFNWKTEKAQFINENGFYTEDAIALINALYYDERGDIPYEKGYHDYNHSYTPFPIQYKRDLYSVSVLEAYYDCPFYFYLEKVLHVSRKDLNSDKTLMRIGNLAHKVFEKIYTNKNFFNDFDNEYENAFEDGVLEYRKDSIGRDAEPTYCELTETDKITIELMRYWLKDIVKAHREILDLGNSNIIDEKAEQKIYFTLKDGEDEYPFTGYIDKLVYSEGASHEKYLTLIDYKSGQSQDFDIKEVFLGGSLQLPLYRIGLEDEANKELSTGYTFAGFGIQHIYFGSVPKDKKGIAYDLQSLKDKIKIGSGNGISIAASDYLDSIDKTTLKPTKEDPNKRKSGDFFKIKYEYDDTSDNPAIEFGRGSSKRFYSIASLYKDAINASLMMLRKIKSGDFRIQPHIKNASDDPHCKLCPYKDICYHSNSDIVDYSEAIERHFGSLEDE